MSLYDASSCKRSKTNTADRKTTIAVVGGGMVGISFALFLAKSLPQVAIKLIEQSPLPTSAHDMSSVMPVLPSNFDARSTAISAGSANLLRQIGCWPCIEKQAAEIRSIHISDKGYFQSLQLTAEHYGVDALGYVVENAWLNQCLRYQLQQTEIECLAPASVSQCQIKKNSVELTLGGAPVSSPTTTKLAVDLVIAADGTNSPLCKMIGIDHQEKAYTQSALIANVELAQPHHHIAYERFTKDGPMALLPLQNYGNTYRASLVWTHPSRSMGDILDMNDAQLLSVLQKTFGYRAGKFLAIGQRQAYPLTQIIVAEQVRSRFVIAGNAAHFLHPVAGQGFNLSLRDGFALADVLSQADTAGENLGSYTVLKRYYEQREKDQDLTVGLTHAMVKVFSSTHKTLSILRQLGLMNLRSHPLLKKAFVKQMMGLSA